VSSPLRPEGFESPETADGARAAHWREFYDQFVAQSAKGHALTMRGVQMTRPSVYELEAAMEKLTVPTLVVTGDEDEPCLEPALFMKRKIRSSGLVVIPKAGHTRDALDELFRERRLKPSYTMELDSSELLKRFVAAGVGVGFIARSNIHEDVRTGLLAAIDIADAQVRRDMALVFRKDKAMSRAALAFIDIAVKHKSTEMMVPGVK